LAANPGAGRVYRRVRVQLAQGALEGGLCVGEQVRTLDDLNMASVRFVTLVDAVGEGAGFVLGQGPVAVHKSRILFLLETGEPPARLGRSAIAQRMHRARIRLRLAEFLVEGSVHVPYGGRPLLRLKQEGHPFLALTDARVVGPYATLEAGFLAVHRDQVVAAQDVTEEGAPVVEMDPAQTDQAGA
jgi:hypothetical protein